MKISLNWVFDHIDSDVRTIDIKQLVSDFIKTTAEIEEWRHVSWNSDCCTLVQVTDDTVVAFSPEHNKTYTLPSRSDVVAGSWYLIDNIHEQPAWATCRSLGGTKETLLPALCVKESLRSGEWKKSVELQDYIIDIDNKSINHRPDLWGHYGIAREIAAILDKKLKKLEVDTLLKKNVSTSHSFNVVIEASQACKRFAALFIEDITNQASDIATVVRLSRLDHKTIDAIVDATNFVMLDLGHPMHAFDAQTLEKKELIVRYANDKESIALLDNETMALTNKDLVVANGSKAIALAGVMGGAATSVTAKTRSLILEAACFDAATIRRTAAKHKKRTEASMRFEKSLDAHQLETVIARFLYVLRKQGVEFAAADAFSIAIAGATDVERTVTVNHARIEQLLGVTISSERVVHILEKLSFVVQCSRHDSEITYTVTVPSFRATKDIAIAEDIVEEVGRYIGYDTIPYVLPDRQLAPVDLHDTYRVRDLKRLLSNGLMMRELYNYSFFDETFLSTLQWHPDNAVELKSPISEHFTHLVTTLQPQLLKAVVDNSIHHTQLRFYEWARVWNQKNDEIEEKRSLCGIFFEQKNRLDFYEGKALLSRLFDELHCEVTWHKEDNNVYPWLSAHQTARIMHNNVLIGQAGMVEETLLHSLLPAGGSAFIFECDGDFLRTFKRPEVHFKPLTKYPAVYRDVSIMINLSATVDRLSHVIQKVDTRIIDVLLIDFFTKKEWNNQKSLTFHVKIQDTTKTLEHAEVEELWNKVIAALQQEGATIR